MAKIDEKIMSMVETELEKKPDLSTSELFEKAKGMNSSAAKLSLRQFHARYPLQVKRRKSRAAQKSGGRKAAPRGRPAARRAGQREDVRKVFLDFATDLTGADGSHGVVKVLAQVDRYVDRVVSPRGRS